jgi:hypothetical protein
MREPLSSLLERVDRCASSETGEETFGLSAKEV